MTDHNPILPEDARIVRIKDTEYVAIHKYWWDKEKKRGQQKRRYIGKLVDGKFVPNAAYAAELKLTPLSVKITFATLSVLHGVVKHAIFAGVYR